MLTAAAVRVHLLEQDCNNARNRWSVTSFRIPKPLLIHYSRATSVAKAPASGGYNFGPPGDHMRAVYFIFHLEKGRFTQKRRIASVSNLSDVRVLYLTLHSG